jgi:hypothetical protein
MVEFVHEYLTLVRTGSGETYLPRVYADRQPSGLWEAWFVFFPLSSGRALPTDRETTQSKREDIVYWATGITPAYLEGALTRALQRLPEARLLRHIAWAEQEQLYARAEAETYDAAAVAALETARAAEQRQREAELQPLGGSPPRRRRNKGRAA